MKTITYSYPKSSFLSLEKDLDLIVSSIMKNENFDYIKIQAKSKINCKY